MLLSDTIQHKCFRFSYSKFRHSNYRIGAHTCTNHTAPYGTALWGGAVPGTSCQATIAPSLRDNSQQALAKACCENGCYFLSLAGMRRSLFKAASSRRRWPNRLSEQAKEGAVA